MKKTLLITGCSILTLVLLAFLAFKVSPWPSALVIRYIFNKEGKKINEQLKKHVPAGVTTLPDLQYIPGDDDANLDIYYPTSIENTQELLPVIVWVHGGGWIAGRKDQISNYCKILASKGFCVIAIDYALAPGKSYPTPVLQTSKALDFIIKNALSFHVDTSRFVLAGDSGGAHIVAQTANIITDPSYATLVGISTPPAMRAEQLRGLVLYCGPYDAKVISQDTEAIDKDSAKHNEEASLFLKTVLWSYMGKKNYESMPGFEAASVINYVTENYPPCFISAGNGDPLLAQSYALVSKLDSLNVKVDSLFFNIVVR